ncbi:extracellular solute-binding protein [Streptomyces sp. TRM43335]|uniref:Extracellular solute-binding protein n=1 Tax=Streptomyces taklimakanensis TaxID=2569853 RepID=A0A6G2B9Q1_9ACTN|nr:extracellular solute-binding protein [Streptomyces taklimakanensis]MTE18954.1 extracellular solute-binding protein [Streptomyces taklimakanensis]
MRTAVQGPARGGRKGTRRHRAAALTATALAASLVLTACGSGGPGEESSDAALEVWVYQDASVTVQQAAVERFNEKSDIKAELVEVPGQNYQDKMRSAMGTPNAPDIFFNWGGGSIANFVEKDMLVDLTPELKKDTEFRDSFIPAILNEGKIDDKYYGIPMRGMQPVMLFYNKKVFKEAGVEPPKTWDDLLDLVDTFKKEGVTPFALAGTTPWTELMWVEYLLDRIGGAEVFDRIRGGDSSAWGDPAVLETARTIQDLVDRGAFGNKYQSVDYDSGAASTLLAKDKAAMFLMGSWEYSTQQSNNPDFAKSDLGWTTFPAMPDGKGDPRNVVGNPTNYWSVNSSLKGERREAAIEFLKTTAEEAYVKDMVENGEVPATTDAEEQLASHPAPDFALSAYDLALDAPSYTLSWDQALPAQQASPMLTNIQKLFNKQLDPEKFVDAMKALK